jgi:hypothetical protein
VLKWLHTLGQYARLAGAWFVLVKFSVRFDYLSDWTPEAACAYNKIGSLKETDKLNS